jgi:hypothetical protein
MGANAVLDDRPELALAEPVDVDSDEPADKIASVVKLAEQSCFAIQSMMRNTPVSASATLKGKALAY